MTSISAIKSQLCAQAQAQMSSLYQTAKAKGLDVKKIIEEDIPVSKYTSLDETFTSIKGVPEPYLFQDTSKQTYMGKQKPQLFAVKDIKTYYEQMCLLLPQLYGTDPTVYPGTFSYDYSPEDFDFSTKGPDGSTVYTKPEDDGSHNKIAVIDCFNSNNEDVCMYIDSTTETMITHGEFVASLVESQVNEYGMNYAVERLGIDIVDGEIKKGVEMMNYVLENIDEYRGVNLSVVAYCDYGTVSDLLGEAVTPSNLASKKQKIMEIVSSDASKTFYDEYKDTLAEGYLPDFSDMVKEGSITQADAKSLSALLQLRYMFEEYGEFYAIADEIAKEGVPVFMASGNYSDQFNFGALLTTKVEYIGASSNTYTNPYTGDKGAFSNNSLVSRKGETTYTGQNVINGKIDVDNNGSGDISAKGVDTSTIYVTGTSFSSPAELVKAIYQGDKSAGTKTAAGTKVSTGDTEDVERIEADSVFVKSTQDNDFSTKNSKSVLNQTSSVYTQSLYYQSINTQNVLGKQNDSKKSWSNILNKLDEQIDYGTTSNAKSVTDTKDMSFSELSAYYASKMSAEVLEAGTNYYNYGKGSLFRYPVVS